MPDQRNSSDSDIAFSRSPIGGKKSAESKYRLTDEHKFLLQRRAHELGMNESELNELFSAIGLLGVDHVRMVQNERLDKVAELFPNGGRIEP